MKKTISNHMSHRLITIGWNEKLSTAYQRMQDQNIRHLPVTNEKAEIIGMLSDRDVQRAMMSDESQIAVMSWESSKPKFSPDARVKHFMSWPVKSIDQYSDIRRVAELMIHEKVSSFLVKNQEQVTGIITAEDLIRLLIEVLSDPQTPKKWTLKSSLSELDFGALEAP